MELKKIEGYYLPYAFFTLKEKIEYLEVRDEDVWVTSYPKSGTTWCQELVWMVVNDLNYEGAQDDLDTRSPFLELECIAKGMKKMTNTWAHGIPIIDVFKLLDDRPNRRCIKTHLPWNLLPRQIRDGTKTPKIIHVMRNPKQVASSYFYHMTKIFPAFNGDINDFINHYIKGEVLYGDYFDMALSYYNKRQLPNLLILTYEEMKADIKSVILKVCDFLGKSYTEEEVDKLAKHLSFEQMKSNPAVNKEAVIKMEGVHFMREGKVDGYKKELSEENLKKLDVWFAEKIERTGLPYETKF